MDKWENLHLFLVYYDKKYIIDLRPRNNMVPGEPTMKVWISSDGHEIAKIDDEFRGYGRYENHPELIPESVMEKAKKTWKRLKEGYYDEAHLRMLEVNFARYKEKHHRISENADWHVDALA